MLERPKLARQASEGRAEVYVEALVRNAVVLDDPPELPSVSPDLDDDYLFALAHAAGAELIVSGDRHLTELTCTTPPVLTPRQFADRLAAR